MAVCTVLFLLWNTVIDYSTQLRVNCLLFADLLSKALFFFLVKPQCEYTDESQLGPLCMSCSGMYTQQLNYYCKTMLKNSVLELRARSALRACLESRKFWDGVCSTDKSLSEVLILFIELRVQYMKTVSSEHVENMLCAQIVFCFCFDIQNNLCSQHVLNMFMYWTRNSMNNLLSYYCGLVDARISYSKKDLPVFCCIGLNYSAYWTVRT